MSMKQAFKDLKGIWPGSDKLTRLHRSIHHGDHYFAMMTQFIGYIGTREEFEACRKEKWHVWSGRGEIPTGVTRVLFRSGEIGEGNLWRWSHYGVLSDIVAYTYE